MTDFKSFYAVPVQVYEALTKLMTTRQLDNVRSLRINQLNINKADSIKVKQKIPLSVLSESSSVVKNNGASDDKRSGSDSILKAGEEKRNNDSSVHIIDSPTKNSSVNNISPAKNSSVNTTNKRNDSTVQISTSTPSHDGLRTFNFPPPSPIRQPTTGRPRGGPRGGTRGRGTRGRGIRRRLFPSVSEDSNQSPQQTSQPDLINFSQSEDSLQLPSLPPSLSSLSSTPPSISDQSYTQMLSNLSILPKKKQLSIATGPAGMYKPPTPTPKKSFSTQTDQISPVKTKSIATSPLEISQSFKTPSPKKKKLTMHRLRGENVKPWTPPEGPLTRTIQTSISKSFNASPKKTPAKKTPESKSLQKLRRTLSSYKRSLAKKKHNTRARVKSRQQQQQRQQRQSTGTGDNMTPPPMHSSSPGDDSVFTVQSSPPRPTFSKPKKPTNTGKRKMPRERLANTSKPADKRRRTNLGTELDLFIQPERTPGLTGVKKIAQDIEKQNSKIKASRLRNDDENLFVRFV